MNIHEGAGRMKRAGQLLVLVPSTIVILLALVATLAAGFRGYIGFVTILAVLALYMAVPGGALWLAAWIVEGFAKEPD
jgi:hypothetical protein